MKATEKNILLDKLSVCYNRTNYLMALCEEREQEEYAARFARRKERLKLEIDGLLRDLLHTWIGDAKELTTKLNGSNKNVDMAIKEIEKSIDTAEKIVIAIGYIDDVIGLAAGLVL